MPRVGLEGLAQLVPSWARPTARRARDAILAIFDRTGITGIRERSYRQRLITHAYPNGAPRLRTSFIPERRPGDIDVGTANRLLAAWRAAALEGSVSARGSAGDVWTGLAKHYHGELAKLLQAGDPHALAGYLCNMSRHDATVGITQGSTEYRKVSGSAYLRRWEGLFILDKLVALAEATGVLRAENPEQGRWGQNLYKDVDELVVMLNRALGVEIGVPHVEGCLFGLESSSGRIHFRDITALYAALRIRAITNRSSGLSVCEIGGGVGRVAFYCCKLGVEDYVIYDLPLINVLQGYFLIRTLPDARIVLCGEEMPSHGRAIKVLPASLFERAAPKSFDVVLNQDSFPEIDRATVREYLRGIARTTRQYFLSINHEAETSLGSSNYKQLVVGDAVQETGGFDRLYRFPCWVRPGYVEELYRCSQ